MKEIVEDAPINTIAGVQLIETEVKEDGKA